MFYYRLICLPLSISLTLLSYYRLICLSLYIYLTFLCLITLLSNCLPLYIYLTLLSSPMHFYHFTCISVLLSIKSFSRVDCLLFIYTVFTKPVSPSSFTLLDHQLSPPVILPPSLTYIFHPITRLFPFSHQSPCAASYLSHISILSTILHSSYSHAVIFSDTFNLIQHPVDLQSMNNLYTNLYTKTV